ncbi:MAG: ATP-binding protein [Thermoleophilaceae bacterium]
MKRETWLPATPASVQAARSIVREAAAEAGLEGDLVWDLMLASTEAVSNAVRHGKPWPNDCVLFATEPCPRGLRVEVCDLGSFDSALEPAPLEATSGRGMQIIAALVDRFEVRNGDGHTLVGFEKHRGRASPAGDPEGEQGTCAGRVNGVTAAHLAIHEHAPRVRPAAGIAADAGGGA